MKKLLLFLLLGTFSIIGLSSFQSFSKKAIHKTEPVLISLGVDGYFGELYFDDTTDQFLSGTVMKEVPNSGGAFRVYTINSVSGSLVRSLLNNQITHFEGNIYGSSANGQLSVTLTLTSNNNAALIAQ
ncbi:hypothetical protein [Pedobacter jeongneungensis]|uniref:hypothetical protein n=1 Tax=Pedobacter jeongneungensis TaxID=947309 RepID=UPI000469FD8A|nr:hypothetical protein [Pedobacter jeongneungensis]